MCYRQRLVGPELQYHSIYFDVHVWIWIRLYSLDRRLSSRTKQPITEEEQEFFDSMEANIRKKQVCCGVLIKKKKRRLHEATVLHF